MVYRLLVPSLEIRYMWEEKNPLNECVSSCMLSIEETFLYEAVLLMLPIFIQMFGEERLFSPSFSIAQWVRLVFCSALM